MDIVSKHTAEENTKDANLKANELQAKLDKIKLLVEEYVAATGGSQDAIILADEVVKIIEAK